MRFLYAIQSICCTVLSTSFGFMPCNINFPNSTDLFFWGNLYSCIIIFSESSEFILEVVDIKYGWEFIFPVFQNLGNWRRRLHLKFSNVLYQIKQTFEENMSSGTTAWQVSKYGVFSGPYFLVFGLNKEIYGVNLRIWTLFIQWKLSGLTSAS